MSSFNPATNANYNATQPVALTATDSQSGVKAVYYKIDSGSYSMVTSSAATFNISGDATHTFSYYAVDNSNNTETVHVSNVFRIDTTPPVTTPSFNPAANANYNANQPVTLIATDSGSGVATTYWRIDSGSWSAGTTFTVSGDGLHTFSYYSVDSANNTESTHVSNQFRIDTVAPATTSSFNRARTPTTTPASR